MTVAVVVQARFNSTRLPAKVLLDLAGRPVLSHVIERCRRIPGVDVVVCAVPDQKDSDLIEAYAQGAGAHSFRGPEFDVLARTLGAARSVAADIVVRITSDCPLIDPTICEQVIAPVRERLVDYSSNVSPRSYPQGLDCEAFSVASLIMADKATKARYDREHVTTYMRRPEAGLRRHNVRTGKPDLADKRWTLDWPEDLEFFRAVHAHGDPQSMDEVLAILAAHPEIEKINAMRKM